jgi:hypothetical protein
MSEPQEDRPPADPWRESMAASWMRERRGSQQMGDPPRESRATRWMRMRKRSMRGRMTPAEWAARHAQDILMFSFSDYRYRDPELDRWMQELGRVLFTAGAVEDARRRYLTEAERQWAEKRALEEF